MSTSRPLVVCYLAAACTLATVGGGCESRPANGTVTGVVTHRGKPLAGAMVLFVPEAGPAAAGVTGPDGRYELTTQQPGDGVRVGRCQIAVRPADPQGKPLPIPDRLATAEASRLEAIVAAGPNVVDLALPDM